MEVEKAGSYAAEKSRYGFRHPEGERAIEQLSQSLELVSVNDQTGVHSYEIETDSQLHYRERELNDSDRQLITYFLEMANNIGYDFSNLPELFTLDGWREIDHLSVERGGNMIDLAAFLPALQGIYSFRSETTSPGAIAFIKSDATYILIWGNPTSVRGVALLAHEIGHSVDQRERDDYEVAGLADEKKELDAMLLRERNATAFELKILREVIKDTQTRENLRLMVHHNDLASYNEDVAQRLLDMRFAEAMDALDNCKST